MGIQVELLNQLIAGIEWAVFTSKHPNGQLHSRPMIARPATPDGCLWFFSAAHSSKVDDIRSSDEVNVALADTQGRRYVSISGTCELIRNHQLAQDLWAPVYESWFPQGPGDPDLILLKVTINSVEYWDAGQSRMLPLLSTATEPQVTDTSHGTLKLRDERKDVA